MNLDTAKFTAIVEAAKMKVANDPKWLRGIEKAARMLASGELCVTLFADNTALVTSPNGSYRVNGACPCAARTAHCYHRVAKRLVELMDAPEASISLADDVAASSRENLIAEIENIWPRFAPGVSLYTELLARFGKSELSMLDDDMLRRVRMAIAM